MRRQGERAWEEADESDPQRNGGKLGEGGSDRGEKKKKSLNSPSI